MTEPTGCAWNAASTVPWIAITAGTTGNGSGTLVYSVAPNTGVSRTGTITVSGVVFTVNQASGTSGLPADGTCCYSLSSTSQSSTSGGGASPVNVVSASGCNWTATSNADWITITSGANGNGGGTVTYSVAPNTSPSSRTGTITIAGQTFTVNQVGAATLGGGCTFNLARISHQRGNQRPEPTA